MGEKSAKISHLKFSTSLGVDSYKAVIHKKKIFCSGDYTLFYSPRAKLSFNCFGCVGKTDDGGGSIFLIPPNRSFILRPLEATYHNFGWFFHIPAEEMEEQMDMVLANSSWATNNTVKATLFHLVLRMVADAERWSDEPFFCERKTLYDVLRSLKKFKEESPNYPISVLETLEPINQKLKKTFNILIDEFLTAPSLNEISERVKYGYFHCNRSFRKYFGVAPYQLIQSKRLDYCRKQLQAGKSSIEIALEGGFSDQSHMIRTFRNHFGFTPMRYQQKVMAK